MLEHKRKKFDEDNYSCNQKAFEYLERDLTTHKNSAGGYYYPVCRPEDYDVDVAVYESEAAYMGFEEPLFFVELELKISNGNWGSTGYPYEDIHFLYRKMHLIHQSATVFWVCYNDDGSDCVMVNMESIASFPIAENSSKVGDLVYLLPASLCDFGTEKLVEHIEQFTMDQTGSEPEAMKAQLASCYAMMNRAYRSRHKYEKVHIDHKKLTSMQQKNKTPHGAEHFL